VSTHSYYQSIHEESPLFCRLTADPQFHLLLAQLMILGPGPFYWSYLEAGEIEGVLDGMAGQGVFASRAQADQMLADVRGEVETVIALDPEIGHRSAYIEQVHHELEDQLLAEVGRRAPGDRRNLVETLLWGDAYADSSGSLARRTPAFRLVSPPVVTEGAAMLGPIEAVDLYPKDKWDRCPAQEYERWRWLYLEASRLRTAVLVLTA
jgi:hypothetical protein